MHSKLGWGLILLGSFILCLKAFSHPPSANQYNCSGVGATCKASSVTTGNITSSGLVTLTRADKAIDLTSNSAYIEIGDTVITRYAADTCGFEGINAANTITSRVASGGTAWQQETGAKLCIGNSASHCFTSSGSVVGTFAGNFAATAFNTGLDTGGGFQTRSNGIGTGYTNEYYAAWIDGNSADGASSYGVHIGRRVTCATFGCSIARFHNNHATTVAARVDMHGFYVQPTQSVTIADNGAGTNASSTINPTSKYIEVTCNDSQGCDITLGTTVHAGTFITIVSNSGGGGIGEINLADSGSHFLSGAFAGEQTDSISLVFASSNNWYEVSRSNN